ncbi:MAG: tRNA pseudouridine(38-40) synthase TruA [Thiohalomonadaceae bacterium]
MRIALGIEYDGSGFSGYQAQAHGVRTVQDALEAAIAKVAAQPVTTACAGRTDAGVHACGQVVHFDTTAERSERAWVYGINANLPKDVCVLWARPVPDDFHARFSAERRAYRYVIFSRPVRPTFLAYRVTWDYRELDAGRMAEAARHLVGEHDFSSYRAVACQAKSPVRTLYRLDVQRHGPYIVLEAEANGFLHHMVRNIAGVLSTIGAGERAPDWAREVLEARDRALGGITAPPYGLYLTEVGYPGRFGLPRLSPPPLVW